MIELRETVWATLLCDARVKNSSAPEPQSHDKTVLNRAKNSTSLIIDKVKNMAYNVGMTVDPATFLRENGLQVTAQRLAVLRAVSDRPHSTADDVTEAVRAEIGTISRQAVYDALGILAEKGLIRRIQPAGSAALYEDRVGDNHHHVICRSCGKTADVDCAVGETPCLTAADHSGYQINEAEVIYWGRCPDCRSSTKRQVTE